MNITFTYVDLKRWGLSLGLEILVLSITGTYNTLNNTYHYERVTIAAKYIILIYSNVCLQNMH